MACAFSLGLCTLLLSTLLIQGCIGQCDGPAQKLRASKDWKLMRPPRLNEKDCQWHIVAEPDGYFVLLRVLGTRVARDQSDCLSVYDGDAPSATPLGSCVSNNRQFLTTGGNMYITYVSAGRGMPLMNRTVQFRAFTNISPTDNLAQTIGFIVGFPIGLGLLVSVIILFCRYACCSTQSSGPASPAGEANHGSRRDSVIPAGRNIPTRPHDDFGTNSALLSSPANRGSRRYSRMSTGRNIPLRPEGQETNFSPTHTDNQPSLRTGPHRNSAPLPVSTRGNSPTAFYGTLPSAPPFEAVWNLSVLSPDDVDAPPSYDVAVASDYRMGGARPERMLQIRLPAYSREP